MPTYSRAELSLAHRLRRSYYELLRDDLDQLLLQYALTDSYRNFYDRKLTFPFVEKRELKPRARIPDHEYESQNTFLVIFLEDSLSREHKKNIRFFKLNRAIKTNLLHTKSFQLSNQFDRTHKYLESIHFDNFFRSLLPVDYALLIQRDPVAKAKNRYSLTHYHVRIDWPIADAAEDLAIELRYISQNLYEKGDKYAEDVQKKFFEHYGQPVMVGGRRTAAIVAAQYFKRVPCVATVYVGSSESRALMRFSEQGIVKCVLMLFEDEEIMPLAEENGFSLSTFKKHYVIARTKKKNVCIFQATYHNTEQAQIPEDGKLREIKPDLNWISVVGQHILPKPGIRKYPPLPLQVIYS